ncbi:MAG TPA: carbamoyltransferase C-terminal domain-containing protein [Vicinamibacterales bacterium]|nr:carbamoyltransferase C-terminal domain-containing protein [Vicinamibacterales bacterium]
MNVLGIWDGHDSGAALLQDGRLCFAVNEERLTRRKLEIRFPSRSIDACLSHAGLDPASVDVVAVSTSDPAKTLARWWPWSKEQYYAVRRRQTRPGPLSSLTRRAKYTVTEWRSRPLLEWCSRAALRGPLARHGLSRANLRLVDHHAAHAAAAACASGFGRCAVVTIDGVGDGLSSTIAIYDNGRFERVAASPARASLGIFFEHVTNLLNMRELEDEGKVMALADYAAPIADADNPLLSCVRVRDGVIEVTPSGFALRDALADVQWRFPNEQFAYLAQRVVEQTCIALARDAVRLTGLRRVALAGGVISNVRATRRVRMMPEIDEVYVFPHMGDGGLAVGAAALAAIDAGAPVDLRLGGLDLGPGYSTAEIAAALRRAGLDADPDDRLPARVAEALEDGRVVMWFDGRMEYGPRALGHRSVLARPDRPDVRDRLNLALKRRVWYQPFCPSMLESEASRVLTDWSGGRNRAMTMAYDVSPCWQPRLAGVISTNGTCRPQVVDDAAPGAFAEVLREARARWGLGVVLNTSFNIHGEPMVCSPDDAVDVFLRAGADALAIGPFFVERSAEGVTAARTTAIGSR